MPCAADTTGFTALVQQWDHIIASGFFKAYFHHLLHKTSRLFKIFSKKCYPTSACESRVLCYEALHNCVGDIVCFDVYVNEKPKDDGRE